MINFNRERATAVFYTCGVCNLNCRYCTIDKNPVLKDIDDKLGESFEGDYYFERVKEYFPRRDMLKRVETWGGEPFLKMYRIYPLVHKLLDYYPYCNNFFSSTNFSYDDWINQFMGLIDCFRKYPERQFTYDLQLSVDGPPYINDANRGKGVTNKCIANFDKLLDIIKQGEFPENVSLSLGLKGTWDLDTIHLLNDKQKLIEFFKFYEDAYLDKVNSLNIPRIHMGKSIPNTAVPSPTTKQDGIIFAELIKKCREIEQENQTEHYFKYYDTITPFAVHEACPHYCFDNCAGCGSGNAMIGFLPNNMVSACHEGFTLLVDSYKDYAAKRSEDNLSVSLNHFFEEYPTPMCLTDDQYIVHEQKMKYLEADSSVQIGSTILTIQALALAGQIESQFLDERNALVAARYILLNSAYCIKANYMITGTFSCEPVDLYKLILNGALQYLMRGGNNCAGNCGCND